MSDGRFARAGGRGGSFHGSNRSQMNAMDLHTRPLRTATGPTGAAAAAAAAAAAGGPAAAASGGSARYGDNSALSARNMLIRHKLMERKRFDSADYAMDKNKRQKEGAPEDQAAAAALSTAQAGVSAFYSAMEDRRTSESTPMADVAPTGGSTAGRAASPAGAGRYGRLASGGAASARSILLQKKLREKKHFDSADYQLAQQQQQQPPPPPQAPSSPDPTGSPSLSVGTGSGGSSPMDVDEDAGGINSPSAARVGVAAAISAGELRLAQMSPSVRGGDKAAFGSPTRRPGPYSSLVPQPEDGRFFVPAGTADKASPTAAATAPSKYGKLSAAHVLIRRQLRERKRFDSADYAMEKQRDGGEREEGADADDGGSADPQAREGCGSGGATSPSISHQVKHIKLSEDARAAACNGRGWAKAAATTTSSRATNGGRGAAMSQDSRLAARSIILQRKLAERKRFDSADYYKARSTTSG